MTTFTRAGLRLREVQNWAQPLLWANCPWDDIGVPGGVEGVKLEDNFENLPTSLVATSNISQKYATWVDTGGTLLQSTTDPLGAAVLTLDTTTNDAASIQSRNLASFIDPVTGTAPYDVWFEAQFEIGTLTDSCFVGLAAYQAPATAAIITDGDIMADIGLVGFSTLQATPTILNFTYKKAGQTVQVPITTVHTMVAATKLAVGFHYKAVNPTERKISVYKNNALVAGGVTKANIEAAPFPDAVAMALTAAIKNFTTTAGASMILNRWKMAMVKGY